MKLPQFPVVFHKAKNSITGPFSDIVMPKQAGNVDYENELCFVIGKDAKNVSRENALSHVLAYTVGNDVSSRAWQMPDTSGGQYCFAKGFDGFCPIGPRLVAACQISDPQALNITTRWNGRVVQESNTADMLFGVADLISFLSQGTTLYRGTM